MELNKGEKERRGIVRLRSDSLIDLRNNNAENILKLLKLYLESNMKKYLRKNYLLNTK